MMTSRHGNRKCMMKSNIIVHVVKEFDMLKLCTSKTRGAFSMLHVQLQSLFLDFVVMLYWLVTFYFVSALFALMLLSENVTCSSD